MIRLFRSRELKLDPSEFLDSIEVILKVKIKFDSLGVRNLEIRLSQRNQKKRIRFQMKGKRGSGTLDPMAALCKEHNPNQRCQN